MSDGASSWGKCDRKGGDKVNASPSWGQISTVDLRAKMLHFLLVPLR